MYLLRPARADFVIPTPTGGDLPATGAIVPGLDLYWVRRVTAGEVTADEVRADTVEAAIAELGAEASTGKGRKAPAADTEQKG